MKISVCIPQYNRIAYLLKNLERLECQTYTDIEVIISDDCSTDDTALRIAELAGRYKYPIIYSRNETNLGYDRNYRKSIELASGEYAFILGNDDALNAPDSLAFLADFLRNENYPEIGYCNMVEGDESGTLVPRAHGNRVLGSGREVALKYYSSFSFVGGLIYKLDTFRKYNTDKCDGSIYSQMYLGVLMILGGARLFCIEKPLVIKDLKIGDISRGSYTDRLARKWKDFRIVDGGLPSVIHVLIMGFRDAGVLSQQVLFIIFRRIYMLTFPYWIMDYRSHGAFPEAWGLFRGLKPKLNKDFELLSFRNKMRIRFVYIASAFVSLFFPLFLLRFLHKKAYGLFKK